MNYFYADFPFKGKIIRLLKPKNGENKAVNWLLKNQGSIQGLAPHTITLFLFGGNYQHTAHSQADKSIVNDFMTSVPLPPVGTVWAQEFLATAD